MAQWIIRSVLVFLMALPLAHAGAGTAVDSSAREANSYSVSLYAPSQVRPAPKAPCSCRHNLVCVLSGLVLPCPDGGPVFSDDLSVVRLQLDREAPLHERKAKPELPPPKIA